MVLIAGSVILLFVSYQLAFKNTIDAWQMNRNLKAKLAGSSDLSYQPGLSERKIKNLDKILNQFRSDSAAFRGNTIGKISRITSQQGVTLSEIPSDEPGFHTDQFIIERLRFEGDFRSYLKALDQIEQSPEVGFVRQVTIKEKPKNGVSDLKGNVTMELLLEIVK